MSAFYWHVVTGHVGLIQKAVRFHKRGQSTEEGELGTSSEGAVIVPVRLAHLLLHRSVTGGASTDLVGALKEAFGKKKEFVHVDLDVELTKLGLKQFVPLDLWPPSMAVFNFA